LPEGDSIHLLAAALTASIGGRRITRLASRIPAIAGAGLVGATISSITARGKWLAMHLTGERVLLSHMRMLGWWYVLRRGQRWPRAEHQARVVMEVEGAPGTAPLVAVCFTAPVVRLMSERAFDQQLAHLGQDMTQPEPDTRAAAARLREVGGTKAIGIAIMDQRALAGVGNVYKSEILHAERVSPLARTSDLDDATLERLAARAGELLLKNVARWKRTTTSGFASTRLAVYERGGRPCPRCGATIVRIVQGRDRRSTYHCPACQPRPA
jgi:endonuclease-8